MPDPAYTTLALVLTYRCALRCRYCPVLKRDESMPRDLALMAVDELLTDDVALIRFSGGDPLGEFATVEALLDHVKRPVRFKLTTNGVDLTDAILDRLEADSRVDLVVSVDGPRDVHCAQRLAHRESADAYDWFERFAPRLARFARPVQVNLVVAPDNASRLVESVHAVARYKLFRYNLLPAYYVEWSDAALAALEESFRKLAAYFEAGRRRGLPFSLANAENVSRQPLYVDALVIDVDGECYDNDAVASRLLHDEKRQCSLGNVRTPERIDLKRIGRENWPARLRARLSEKAWESTQRVDDLLARISS
ncbi:MAG: radical SAM protein [Myxococcales bacterium]|nr:MAG: radical SAM protein [Myxococcales bacterium]